jgi:hypothetical protein
MCCWVGGLVGTIETSLKVLILSKSQEYSKLDSLAYDYGMRVFAYIPAKDFKELGHKNAIKHKNRRPPYFFL